MNYLKSFCLAGCILLLCGAASAAESSPPEAPAGWPAPVSDEEISSFVLFDQFEYRRGADVLHWDVLGWIGGDYNRLWIETEGDHRTDGDGGEIDKLDMLYGRLITPFWDIQTGVGYQLRYGDGHDHGRLLAVVGLQGLAPYGFEVDTNLRVSEHGDVSADLEAEYDLLLTQRLILQPRLEADFALQEVEDFGVGQGINSVSLGLRLRYELRREFAPYVGVVWMRKFGDTADLARDEGDDQEDLSLVLGLRLWF